MRGWLRVTLVLALGASSVGSAAPAGALRFAWPARGEAIVEVTDERVVGDELRSVVLTRVLRVEPDESPGRLVLRFSDARIVSVDHLPVALADPAGMRVAVGRVMKHAIPTMVVGTDGRYAESRELDRVAREIADAAGFPSLPPALEPFRELVDGVARTDWSGWVGAWLGRRLEPGEWTQSEGAWDLDGARVPVRVTWRGLPSAAGSGRARLQASAVYPSKSVRRFTTGFLIDMARDAKELGGDDTAATARFVERAQFSPVTETLTVELESATMRPLEVERTRTFSAVAGGHWVSGTERRVHRFTWSASGGSAAAP